MKVLVTGATGFVGHHLIECLSSSGYEIRCLVRKSSRIEKLKKYSDIEFFYGDVTEKESLKGIEEGIDYVVHLAAMGHVSAVSEEAYAAFTSINEQGTRNLLSQFVGSRTLKKFIHFSSTAAMGPVGVPVLDERSEPNPRTPYQKSKLRSEQAALSFYADSQVPVTVIRPCMIYGPGGLGEFHKFCRLMKKGIFPKIGFGKNLTPMVYVKDVVSATEIVMEKGIPGECYIVASDTSFPMDDIRNCIVRELGVKVPYIFVPAFAGLTGAKLLEILFNGLGREPVVTYRNMKSTVTDRTFNIEKIKKLGYIPRMEYRQGIKNTIQWYKNNHLI